MPIDSAWSLASGTTGKLSCSSLPSMYSGIRGPGMFETTRLNVRGLETRWETTRWTGAGA